MRIEETDVVIVGGGVPGLVLAAEAFRRGLRARVLDREPSLAAPARAAVYQPRALESLAALGLYDAVSGQGSPLRRVVLHGALRGEPEVALDYAEAGCAFPHALGAPDEAVLAACVESFAKYTAVRVEQGVEMLSLDRERGRVAGVHARGPQGDVTYRAKLVAVATASGRAPVRAEIGAAARSAAYPGEHLALHVPRPEGWPEELAWWLGRGAASVWAYPAGAALLRVEAVAAGGALSAARSRGADALRRLLVGVAAPLDAPLKALAARDGDGDGLPGVLSVPGRSRVKTWVDDALVLLGPAARSMTPCGACADSAAVLDASALALVLSRCSFTGDFSRPALAAYETARRPAADAVAALAHDLHLASTESDGLHARARVHAPRRLAASPALRRRVVRLLAGRDEPLLGLAERLRLAGLWPGAR